MWGGGSLKNLGSKALVEVSEDDGPGLRVAQAGFFVGETGVRETQQRSGALGRELNGDHRFGASGPGGSRDPSHFDKADRFEAQEAAIVRMTLAFEVRLKKEGGIYFRLHDDRPGRGEPTIELLGPRAVERVRGSPHGALGRDFERTGRKIGRGNGCGHRCSPEISRKL